MDSQTFKITMFLGLALLLVIVAFLALGVTKDFAFAFGGKFGLKGTEDEKTFVTNPSNVEVDLKCERNEEQLKSGQFLYKINIKNAKLQSEGTDDIRPVLYFKSRVLKAKSGSKLNPEGIIPAETVKTGNLGELKFELETVSLPTYTKEFYTLFLLKKSDKCENAISGAISEQVLISQCGRDLLAKFDATTNSCTKGEIPFIKLERIETWPEKNKCSPIFKVINNDNFDWQVQDGYKAVIRNCFPNEAPPLNDLWRPSKKYNEFRSASISGGAPGLWYTYEIPRGSILVEDASKSRLKDRYYCSSLPEERTIELYKDCKDGGYDDKDCTNLYDTASGSPPTLIDSITFTC
ncbi:MAG: hypothetical protein HY515_03485 [Candidatus Aenigmarchaeota archaeon]|nr:hypothetical protein [Candidatus Aenigmarchaeota archaeon]